MKNRKIGIILFLLILLFSFLLPQNKMFSYEINNKNNNNITNLPSTSATNIYKWFRTWGGSDRDEGNGIAVDNSGNAFITGKTDSFGAGAYDVFLLKYDSAGNQLWNTTWGGFNDDMGYGIAVDISGSVFITGYTYSFGPGRNDAFLLKYDSAGNQLWNTTWGGSSNDEGYGIALDGSGNVFITGYTGSYGAGAYDVILLKYDSDGNLLWDASWGGFDFDFGYGIAVDGSGNSFIIGSTESYGEGSVDALLLKYDSDGNQLWNTTWGGSNYDFGYGITVDGSGNAFITGRTDSYGPGSHDVFLIEYDSDGNLLWNTTWGSYYGEYGYGIAVDGSGSVFITGYTGSYGASGYDVFLLNYDLDGNLLWDKIWGGSEYDRGYAITVDGSGNVFITGSTPSYGEGSVDALLLKYEIDTDNDGSSDDDEVLIYRTDPNSSDTDDDGFTDGQEVNSGTDPLIFIDNWLSRGVVISISITTLIICYIVIRKKKVKKVNIIMERGEKLKAQANLEKAIETYQEAHSKANGKFVPKSMRSTIRTKLDNIIVIRIEENIIQGEKIIDAGDLDKAIDNFNTQLEKANSIFEMSKREKLRNIIQEYLAHSKMLKTKKIIADLATKYARLEVRDIAEKCGAEESIIIPTIQTMIKNREISAEYFKASKAIAFSQQIDVDEIDNLMKSFEDWEKEGKDKKI